jgi:hypothetical protein
VYLRTVHALWTLYGLSSYESTFVQAPCNVKLSIIKCTVRVQYNVVQYVYSQNSFSQRLKVVFPEVQRSFQKHTVGPYHGRSVPGGRTVCSSPGFSSPRIWYRLHSFLSTHSRSHCLCLLNLEPRPTSRSLIARQPTVRSLILVVRKYFRTKVRESTKTSDTTM